MCLVAFDNHTMNMEHLETIITCSYTELNTNAENSISFCNWNVQI